MGFEHTLSRVNRNQLTNPDRKGWHVDVRIECMLYQKSCLLQLCGCKRRGAGDSKFIRWP